MKKFAVVGVYGKGEDFTTGQAVKCNELINWLIKEYGNDNIYIVNTYKWKKNPLKLFKSFLFAFKNCEKIIILPAQHGLKVFAPLCYYFNQKYGKKVEYIVIGGWLAEVLETNKKLKKYVQSFDGVFAETKTMVEKLKNIGIERSYYLPNTRYIPKTIRKDNSKNTKIKLCTYSRVTEDKGIIDAIEIVKKANETLKRDIFTLDIYGKIASDFEEKFKEIINDNRKIVNYCGIKNFDEGVQTISNYFCLLFPTFYEGEGFAGTILDSFAAGIPVLANDWKYNSEIISDGETGLIYSYRDIEEAKNKLCTLYNDESLYRKIQINSKNESKKYTPDVVYSYFIKMIN